MAHISTASISVPQDFNCPILHQILEDPVVAADGFTYERSAIEEWFRTCGLPPKSPMTSAVLPSVVLTPNHALKAAITAYLEQRPEIAVCRKVAEQYEDLQKAVQTFREEASGKIDRQAIEIEQLRAAVQRGEEEVKSLRNFIRQQQAWMIKGVLAMSPPPPNLPVPVRQFDEKEEMDEPSVKSSAEMLCGGLELGWRVAKRKIMEIEEYDGALLLAVRPAELVYNLLNDPKLALAISSDPSESLAATRARDDLITEYSRLPRPGYPADGTVKRWLSPEDICNFVAAVRQRRPVDFFEQFVIFWDP